MLNKGLKQIQFISLKTDHGISVFKLLTMIVMYFRTTKIETRKILHGIIYIYQCTFFLSSLAFFFFSSSFHKSHKGKQT